MTLELTLKSFFSSDFTYTFLGVGTSNRACARRRRVQRSAKSSILNTQFLVFNTRFVVVDTKFLVFHTHFLVFNVKRTNADDIRLASMTFAPPAKFNHCKRKIPRFLIHNSLFLQQNSSCLLTCLDPLDELT